MVPFRSRHGYRHGRGYMRHLALSTLVGVLALLVMVLPVVAEDVALRLPDVAIPPVQGKTLSSDLFEIDQAAHVMYLADRTDHGVDVFDVSTPGAKYVKTIPTGTNPNGVILAKNVNKLYVGGADSSVVVIDINPASMHRDAVIARVGTGGKKRVDEGDYDPVDRKLYVANGDDGFVTVLDATNDRIIKKFTDLGEGLEQPRYNPSDGQMYMTSSDQDAVFEFNPRTDTLVKKYELKMGCEPNGLAINPKTNQALLGCSAKKPAMTVLWDLKAKTVVTTFTQVGASDQVFYSAKSNLFFAAARNDPRGPAIGIFTGGPNARWVANAPSAPGAHGVGYDETNHVVYVQNQAPNSAAVIAYWLPAIPK